MMETREPVKESLLVGYDLGNRITQMYCYNEKNMEPEPIGADYQGGITEIPTMLVRRQDGQWLFGQEAKEYHPGQGDVVYRDFVRAVSGKGKYKMLREEALEVLEKYFRKTLTLLKLRYPGELIRKMVLTSDYLTEELMELLYEVLGILGIGKDRVSIKSHSRCYLYYVMNYDRDFWCNGASLFDYSEQGMFYYSISVEQHKQPVHAKVETIDLSDQMGPELLRESPAKLGATFETLAKTMIYKKTPSTFFVTGNGFEGAWTESVLQKICTNGRFRVFAGQNLYARGACMAAKHLLPDGKFKAYAFFTDESVKYSISLKGYKNAKEDELFFCHAGEAWYEAGNETEIILDGKKTIRFSVYDSARMEIGAFELKLKGIQSRPPRMTRMELRLFYVSADMMVIQAKDKGFGGVYPSSRRIWEETVRI